MEYRIKLHQLAEAELAGMYDEIAATAGPEIASHYVGGIYELIRGLKTFAQRGTVREGDIPGLRIIGYRRTTSIAFVVDGDVVTVLGVFRRGKNIVPEVLQERF